QIIEIHDVCAFIQRTNADGAAEILLRRRADEAGETARNWWRGMWELPRTSVGADETPHDALRRVLRELGVVEADSLIHIGAHLKTLQHGVTHHRITLDCWAVTLEGASGSKAQWFTMEATLPLAMPSTMRRLLAWLRRHVTTNQQLPLL
ncbi:MAG TPA: NUDIX domain-containing protein, partial [Abditibacteriaceae bacterium]|nr:NUDIX domain-containing protein [Abditibacteriaceae bacterium]